MAGDGPRVSPPGGSTDGGEDALPGTDRPIPRDAPFGPDAGLGPDAPFGPDAPLGPDAPPDAPRCVPVGPELCFNGQDDDCDLAVDCEDSDCGIDRARCIPDGMTGILLTNGGGACPMDFRAVDRQLGSGILAPPCSGCRCGVAPVTCSAGVTFYYEEGRGQCLAGSMVPPDGVWFSTLLRQSDGCKMNTPSPLVGLHVYALLATAAPCPPGGQPKPGSASWGQTVRFCGTTVRGGGCGASRVCSPVSPGQRQCLLLPAGATACPAGTTAIAGSWFESFTDDRSCGACQCGPAADGACTGMRVELGGGGSCASPALSAGLDESACGLPVASPVASLIGAPVSGTCAPMVSTVGPVTPVGPRVVCCL